MLLVERSERVLLLMETWVVVLGSMRVKRISAHGGCLGTSRRRRTWQAAKSLGELQASVDPGVSEWGNPAGVILRHSERRANPGN